MFGSHCDENNYFHCTIGSVMHLFNKCVYIYNCYESRNRKLTNYLCCKKAFHTNGIEIKYNCAKRYHILWNNCAKGIVFGLQTVLNVTIFLLHFLSLITL